MTTVLATKSDVMAVPIVAFGGAGQGADADPQRLGAKAAHLVRLAALGLPVPPGFVLTTDVCRRYLTEGEAALDAVFPDVVAAVRRLEAVTGCGFGSARRPLLVSVRSGAAVSMPGMLETVLNVGLNRASLDGLVRTSGSRRFAFDCRRRFLQQYAEVVCGLDAEPFDRVVEEELQRVGVDRPAALDFAEGEVVCDRLEEQFRALAGEAVPEDPWRQLRAAIAAVFRSWVSERARAFRRLTGLGEDGGTAVTVQTMVYGNTGPTSGSGVLFTRDPDTGAPEPFVDFRFDAQGEDVVAGRSGGPAGPDLGHVLPPAWAELQRTGRLLEAEFGDMQDIEFTVERGRLWILQARTGWRAPRAAVRIAVDLVDEGRIDRATAVGRLADIDLAGLTQRRLQPGEGVQPIGRGIVACGGCAVGVIALSVAAVRRVAAAGMSVILVRRDLETDDIEALPLVEGVVSARGARTAHAAVVARRLGKTCLVGCQELRIADDRPACWFNDVELAEGALVSLAGDSGAIFRGALPVSVDAETPEATTARAWRAVVEARSCG